MLRIGRINADFFMHEKLLGCDGTLMLRIELINADLFYKRKIIGLQWNADVADWAD